MNAKHYFSMLLLCGASALAQVGVGTTAPAGALDITSTNSGIVIPRVALTNTITDLPVTNPAGGALVVGTLVWNTATAGAAPNNVTPGYYYWSGSAWVRFATGATNAWNLTGNAGTTPASNYLGTTDAQPLRISTAAAERLRVLANGQVVVNGTAATAGDRFSSYGATGEFAVNGYSTGGGAGVYGQNTGTGYGVYGINNSSGIAVLGNNLSTGAGVLGITSGAASAGVFGRADVAGGTGVYGTTNGANGQGLFGNATGAGGAGLYAQASGLNGSGVYAYGGANSDGVYSVATTNGYYGVWGINNVANSTGVYGTSSGTGANGVWGSVTAANASGVYGLGTQTTSFGVRARNSVTNGVGLVAAGSNLAPLYLNGSGATTYSNAVGLAGFASTVANGVGIAAAGNGSTTVSIPTEGAGGSFSGTRWGTYGRATVTGAGNNAIDRGAFMGEYVSDNSTLANVYVGARIGGVHYKILGTNGGSVSTTMPTSQGERVLFAPESPENWFFDMGEVQLVNGKAEVKLDPIFVECISDAKPFKVFVQGGEDTMGYIRVTRDQINKSFLLEDMGGASNGIVQFSVHAIWKGKEGIRFPELKAEERIRTTTLQAKESVQADTERNREEKKGGIAPKSNPEISATLKGE